MLFVGKTAWAGIVFILLTRDLGSTTHADCFGTESPQRSADRRASNRCQQDSRNAAQ